MTEHPEGDEGRVRVSDRERQVVVDRLSSACAEGILSLDEFAEASGEAYSAVYQTDLDEVIRQLHLPVVVPSPIILPSPESGEPPAETAPPRSRRTWAIAIMSGHARKGRWHVRRRMGAFALMGSVELDLREALLESNEIEITAWAIMGSVAITVPEGIPVDNSGLVVMGGHKDHIRDVAPLAGAPVVRVRARGLWGEVAVRSKPSRDEERARRAARRAERGARRGARRARVPPPLPPTTPRPDAAADRPTASDQPPEPTLVTIVCTDIVGSTRILDQLGDQRWSQLLHEHNAIIRGHLADHGGTEIKVNGDGFLLTFPSARGAIHFGLDIQQSLASHRMKYPDYPIAVRVGVHAGEVERDGTDILGRNVHLASRLCDASTPGEVLVSSVVSDLANSASDLAFGEGRDLRLAGIDRVVRAHPASLVA